MPVTDVATIRHRTAAAVSRPIVTAAQALQVSEIVDAIYVPRPEQPPTPDGDGFGERTAVADAEILDLAERADQPLRAAGDDRAAGVGVELTRARDRRLNQHRRDWRQDDRRQQRERVGALAIVAALRRKPGMPAPGISNARTSATMAWTARDGWIFRAAPRMSR